MATASASSTTVSGTATASQCPYSNSCSPQQTTSYSAPINRDFFTNIQWANSAEVRQWDPNQIEAQVFILKDIKALLESEKERKVEGEEKLEIPYQEKRESSAWSQIASRIYHGAAILLEGGDLRIHLRDNYRCSALPEMLYMGNLPAINVITCTPEINAVTEHPKNDSNGPFKNSDESPSIKVFEELVPGFKREQSIMTASNEKKEVLRGYIKPVFDHTNDEKYKTSLEKIIGDFLSSLPGKPSINLSLEIKQFTAPLLAKHLFGSEMLKEDGVKANEAVGRLMSLLVKKNLGLPATTKDYQPDVDFLFSLAKKETKKEKGESTDENLIDLMRKEGCSQNEIDLMIAAMIAAAADNLPGFLTYLFIKIARNPEMQKNFVTLEKKAQQQTITKFIDQCHQEFKVAFVLWRNVFQDSLLVIKQRTSTNPLSESTVTDETKKVKGYAYFLKTGEKVFCARLLEKNSPPFSNGPDKCPASTFNRAVFELVVTMFLKEYTITPASEKKIRLVGSNATKLEKDFFCTIKKR